MVLSKKEHELKIQKLELEKNLAEFGLEVEELKKRFDDAWGIVPQLKGRIEELEVNEDVIILGLTDIKSEIADISTRLKEMENRLSSTFHAYEERLQKIRGDVADATDSLKDIRTSEISSLREIVEKCNAQIDLLQKNLDSISSNIRSLEKMVNMTDNSAILKQIDALNLKIVNLSVALEQLKPSIPDTSGISKDIEQLNGKMQTMQSHIMAIRDELAEKEKKLLLDEVEIDKLKNMHNRSMEDVQKKLKEYEEKFIRAKNLDVLATFGVEARRKMAEIERARFDVEKSEKNIQRMFYDFNKRAYEIASLRQEFEKLKETVFKLEKMLTEKPKASASTMYFDALNKKIDEAKQKMLLPDKTLMDIIERLKLIEERISLLEVKSRTEMEVPVIIE